MKKKLLIIISIVIVAIITVMAFVLVKRNDNYSLEEVKELIELSYDMSDNLYFSSEYFDGENNSLGKTEMFKKDGITHSKQYSSTGLAAESIINANDNTLYTIMHSEKNIYCHTNYPADDTNETNEFIYSSARNDANENLGIYEFLGMEMVNDRKCIKVSLTDIVDDTESVTIYYIDSERGYTLKTENIEDGKVIMSIVNVYDEGNVTDEEAAIFDINNYPEYTLVSD